MPSRQIDAITASGTAHDQRPCQGLRLLILIGLSSSSSVRKIGNSLGAVIPILIRAFRPLPTASTTWMTISSPMMIDSPGLRVKTSIEVTSVLRVVASVKSDLPGKRLVCQPFDRFDLAIEYIGPRQICAEIVNGRISRAILNDLRIDVKLANFARFGFYRNARVIRPGWHFT